MILSPEEAERYYRVWWPLLKYVNEKKKIIEHFPENPMNGGIKFEDAVNIRDVLWGSDGLLEGFVASNPAGLNEDDLGLAASWKHRLASRFIIIKHLKKYSVFLIEQEQPRAFAVLGILSPLEDTVQDYLPVMVEAVLLPFEDKIIYDGIIRPYNISFGSSIRSRFNQVYRTVQELSGITITLGPDTGQQPNAEALLKGNQKILQAFRREMIKSGLSVKKSEEHCEVVEQFVNRHLLQADPPRSLLSLKPDDVLLYSRLHAKQFNRVSFKRLVRFLDVTERISLETAEALENLLKTL